MSGVRIIPDLTITQPGPSANFNPPDQQYIANQVQPVEAETASLQIQVDNLNQQVQAGIAVKRDVHVASPPIVAGQAFVMVSGNVHLADSSALTDDLDLGGIALTGGVGGQQITIFTQGLVDPAVKNLGVGVAAAVGCDSGGNAVRVTDAACVTRLKHLGFCDTQGSIYVQPITRTRVDVSHFGASTSASASDNRTAFNAAIAMANVVATTNYPLPPFTQFNSLNWIYVPPGSYNLPGPLYIYRSTRFFSDNMGAWAQGYEALGVPQCALIFPKGSPGIIIETAGTEYDGSSPSPNPTNTTGKYSTFADINLFGGYTGADAGQAGGVPVWTPHHDYVAGDVVIPSYFLPFGYAYVAQNNGTSGALEPVWASGNEINPFPAPTYTTTDNGITWSLVRADGFVVNDVVTIERCRVIGFAGNGIAVFADVTLGNGANGVQIHDCFLGYNGGSGLAIAGGDTNAGFTSGLTLHHNGGYGLYDFAPLGNTHVAPQSAGNRAGGYYSRSSTFQQAYSEAGDGPYINADGAKLFGATIGDGFLSGDYFADWTAGLVHNVNDIINESTSGQYWICSVGGTSAGARPNFTNNAGGPFGRDPFGTRSFVNDNGVIWLAYSEPTDSCAPTWRANRVYPTGTVVRSTGTQGAAWKNEGAQFTSGAVEPVWNVASGSTTPDNGGLWTEIGKGTTLSTGVAVIDTGGSLGTRHTQFVQRAGPVTLRKDIGSHTIPTAIESWASDDQPLDLFRRDWDAANHRWVLSLGGLPANHIMEWTGTGATPEGAAQAGFPNGVWAGSYNDPTAPSFLGSGQLVLDGGRDSNQGHYLGRKLLNQEGYYSTDATTNVAYVFALPVDALGAVCEIEMDVVAKEISTGTDAAYFKLRGMWRRDGGVGSTVFQSVELGEPTDGTHCTAGATTWRAVFTRSGTNVEVQVTGANAHDIRWYLFVTNSQGIRT